MTDEPPRITRIFLAGDPDEISKVQWPVVEPRALAMLCLRDCEEQLRRVDDEPLRLVQAAKSAHLALQSALIEALAGSANIGAYDEKLRAKYLAYFEASRGGKAPYPASDRVMSFNQLLAKAMEHPMEWSGRKLEVTRDELAALEQLTMVRDRVEHPRPDSHIIAPPFITATLPVAARLTLGLLDVCGHRYEEGERSSVEATIAAITNLCDKIK